MADDMNMVSSEVGEFEDLVTIRDLGPDEVSKVVDALREIGPKLISATEVIRIATDALQANSSGAQAIVSRVFVLCTWMRQEGVTAEQAVTQLLRDWLQRDSGWSAADFERWALVERPLWVLAELPVVRLASNAVALSYEHPNLLRMARIITDVRPLFSENATEVEGAVISHRLRIRFERVEGPREIEISLDQDDVRRLAIQCERAILKAETASRLMKDCARVPVQVSGEAPEDGD